MEAEAEKEHETKTEHETESETGTETGTEAGMAWSLQHGVYSMAYLNGHQPVDGHALWVLWQCGQLVQQTHTVLRALACTK